MRRNAATARWRVCSVRRRAAAMTRWELSARIGGLGWFVLFDLTDHPVQIGQNLLVHLGDAGVSFAGGHLDKRECAAALLAQFGEEFRAGDNTGQVRQASLN
jgi:hypothetical protein